MVGGIQRSIAEFRFDNGDNVEKALYGSFYVLTDLQHQRLLVFHLLLLEFLHILLGIMRFGENKIVETLRDTIQYLPLAPSVPHMHLE